MSNRTMIKINPTKLSLETRNKLTYLIGKHAKMEPSRVAFEPMAYTTDDSMLTFSAEIRPESPRAGYVSIPGVYEVLTHDIPRKEIEEVLGHGF